MRIITKRALSDFWLANAQYRDAQGPLEAWYAEARHAHWTTPAVIKAQYRHASILKNSRVVFNIAGNKYRLVVHINYRLAIVFVRFLGTHAQYDQINAETI